jgi:hypothetical protein
VVLAPRLGLRHHSQGSGRRQNKVVVAFAIPAKKKIKQFCVTFREKYAIYMYVFLNSYSDVELNIYPNKEKL